MARSDSRIEAERMVCPACGLTFHYAMLEFIRYAGWLMWCCLDCLEVRGRFKGYEPVRQLQRAATQRRRRQRRIESRAQRRC